VRVCVRVCVSVWCVCVCVCVCACVYCAARRMSTQLDNDHVRAAIWEGFKVCVCVGACVRVCVCGVRCLFDVRFVCGVWGIWGCVCVGVSRMHHAE